MRCTFTSFIGGQPLLLKSAFSSTMGSVCSRRATCGAACDVCGGWHRCARSKPGHSRHWCGQCIVFWWDERDKEQSRYRRWLREQEEHEGHEADYAADRNGFQTVDEGAEEGS